jgi:methionine transaminase
MRIQSKLPEIGTTIFTVMSKLAVDYKAINLGQGFPDFNPDPLLLNLVSEAMQEGHNQYPYMPGIEPLRTVVAEKVKTLYKKQYDKDTEITITSGATEALMAAILACVHINDEVIVIDPSYDSYAPAVRLAGGTPIRIPMIPPPNPHARFRVNWPAIRHAIGPKTRLIIVNTPHNPTGTVLTNDDLEELESIVTKHDLLVISDEVYEHITFLPEGHLSLASRPILANRTFVISSFGKTTHTTGWKVGYCCAPKDLTAELRKVHQFLVFTVPTPFQYALARYTANPTTYLTLPKFYQQKRDRLLDGLRQSRFKPYDCPATFFLLADYSAISDLPEAEFAKQMTVEHAVAVIPLSAFYEQPNAASANNKLVRFCFAKNDNTLDQAVAQLRKL